MGATCNLGYGQVAWRNREGTLWGVLEEARRGYVCEGGGWRVAGLVRPEHDTGLEQQEVTNQRWPISEDRVAERWASWLVPPQGLCLHPFQI